jgi:hypothetical protein
MTRKIVYMFILLLIPLVSGCVTAPSTDDGIWVAGLSESLTRYYIPATTWQAKTNRSVSCRLDITYIDEPGRPAVCNISFFNKSAIPKEVTLPSFTADGRVYPLDEINVMFVRAEYNELRITSVIKINELLNLFQSDKILLKAVIDSVEYTFEPDKRFMRYREQFLGVQRGSATVSGTLFPPMRQDQLAIEETFQFSPYTHFQGRDLSKRQHHTPKVRQKYEKC